MRCYKLRLNLDFLMGSSLAFLQSHETPGYPNMGVIELWNLLDSVSQHTLHRILCLRLCISEEWRNSVFTMGSNPFFFEFCFDSYAYKVTFSNLLILDIIESTTWLVKFILYLVLFNTNLTVQVVCNRRRAANSTTI